MEPSELKGGRGGEGIDFVFGQWSYSKIPFATFTTFLAKEARLWMEDREPCD
jgi:hypothetical protein